MSQELETPAEEADYDELYKRALRNLGVTAEGVLDEGTFGLYDKYMPGARARGEKHNISKNIGRLGSYAIPIPLPNKAKLLTKGPEALQKLMALIANSQLVRLSGKALEAERGLLARGAVGAAKGAAHGVATGEAQHLARKTADKATDLALPEKWANKDTSTPADTGSRLALESLFGAGGRALAKGAKELAPVVYNHPAIMNKFKPEYSEKGARELLDLGVVGRLRGGFKKQADKWKGQAGKVFDDVQERVVGMENQETLEEGAKLARNARIQLRPPHEAPRPKGTVNAKDIHQTKDADVRTGKRSGMGEAEQKTYDEAYNSAEQALAPDKYGRTSTEEISKSLRENNTKIANLKAEARAKAQGAVGLGDNSNEIDRVRSLKTAHEKVYRGQISKHGDDADLLRYDKAKAIHRKGADLDGNMRTNEILNTQGTGIWYNDALRNALGYTVKSAPIRSGLGFILDRASKPNLLNRGGLAAELRSRKSGKAPEIKGSAGSDELLIDLPPVEEGEPEVDNAEAQAASAKKFGLSDPKILAAIQNPEDPEALKAGSEAHRRQNPKLYKKFDGLEDDDENLLIKLPPVR